MISLTKPQRKPFNFIKAVMTGASPIPAYAGFLGRSGWTRFVSIGRFTQNHQTPHNNFKVTGVTKQALVTIPIRISFGHGILPCRVQIAGRVRPTNRWHSAGEFFCRLSRAFSIVVGRFQHAPADKSNLFQSLLLRSFSQNERRAGAFSYVRNFIGEIRIV